MLTSKLGKWMHLLTISAKNALARARLLKEQVAENKKMVPRNRSIKV